MRGKPPGPKAILVSGWILILIATAVIIARLNLRLNIQHRRILISDVLICGAWLSAVCLNSMNIVLTRHGALEPQVKTTMEGFTGDAEELSFVLETSYATPRHSTEEWKKHRKLFMDKAPAPAMVHLSPGISVQASSLAPA
ncbi:archaeal flagellin n-terminal-like domain-containing protein [Ilyonectria robusta]